MRPDVVQRAAVLMHFSPSFARRVHGGARVAHLEDDELALLRSVDARAFRTDPERPLRLLGALLEEYPVSAAVAGADVLPAFLTSSPFEHAILRGRIVADAFGDWLFARAGSVALLELAVALARRRRSRRSSVDGGIARAPGVEVVRAPAGTLAFYADARAKLGPAGHIDVARGLRLEEPVEIEGAPPEYLLVTALDAGAGEGPSVATCGDALFSLLSFARDGLPRAALVDEARRLGADHEAASLVDDLVRDGLLSVV